MLVCGFDGEDKGYIFSVADPGVVESRDVTGFAAIGARYEAATDRLLWNAVEPEDDLDLAMYQVFEAKRHAERIQGVGGETDMWIVLPNERKDVPDEVTSLLADVVNNATSLPFKTKNLAKYNLPKRWEPRLKEYADALLHDD